MEFIDKKDTGKEPQPIELGFLHYMAAGMSLADIRKMSPEDLIKVGNEYLEKEPSAIKAFEKLIKKYSHMKENIKAEDKVSLSELLEGYCSVCGMATCESGCNSKKEEATLEEGPYSEAYLQSLEDSLKTLVDFLKDQQREPDTIKHRHVLDQLPELIDTLEDISFTAGYERAMKEEEEDRDEELIAKLTPVRQYIDESYYETSDLQNTIITLGYDDFEEFFRDNQGAEEAVDDWINSVKAFREVLGRQDDSDIYEDYDADAEQDDEDVPNPVDDDGKPLEEESLNEAPNFEIIDKCLADYRKWARKQGPNSQELYDTTQAFIKTLQRLG